jgi:cytochrome c peroxidase
MNAKGFVLGLCLLSLVGCKKDDPIDEPVVPIADPREALLETPAGFPAIQYPEDNPFSWPKWELGKKLFYDNILSSDNSISCGSCHKISNAFSDITATSKGAENTDGTRNSPTLANVAYLPYFTREGGVPTLEMQILIPIQEHNEFNSNIVVLSEKLNEIDEYVQMSQAAFERNPDPFVITRALATFERTMISGNSKFDQFEYQGIANALSAQQIRGKDLFYGKANCVDCHSGFNFTDNRFTNNGLYEAYEDVGRYRLTLEDTDVAVFKVPTLRNIALTGPFMHDGSIETLDDVVKHYNMGGFNHPNKSSLIEPLNLTHIEIEELVSFLKSLTDLEFTQNAYLAE